MSGSLQSRNVGSEGLSPLVLTVNGCAELVVLGSERYQEISEILDAVAGIQRGLEAKKKGSGRSARAR